MAMPWPSRLTPGVASTVGYGAPTVLLRRRSPRRRDGCVESATARELPHSLAVSHLKKTKVTSKQDQLQNQRAAFVFNPDRPESLAATPSSRQSEFEAPK
jgi:hypothetical protein